MSGNQYVYSLESRNGYRMKLELVTKNRKKVWEKMQRLVRGMSRTHSCVSSESHRDLYFHVAANGGQSAVCDAIFLMPKGSFAGKLRPVQLIATAWVIKYAKPEGPVRGTLKERMGIRQPGYAPEKSYL